MPSKDKHHVLLRLDVETYQQLAALAKSRERSVPQEIRLALRQHLATTQPEPSVPRPRAVEPRFKR